MKPLTTYKPIHTTALAVMVLYVFVFIGHLFVLPNLNTSSCVNHNYSLKRKAETYLNLQRTDKIVITEKNVIKTGSKNNSGPYILLFTSTFIPVAKQLPHSTLFQFLPDHHYAYLSNRVIRI